MHKMSSADVDVEIITKLFVTNPRGFVDFKNGQQALNLLPMGPRSLASPEG